MKTSLGALSKNVVGKVGSSHCYLDRRPLQEITFDETVYEYDKKKFSAIGITCIIKSNFLYVI